MDAGYKMQDAWALSKNIVIYHRGERRVRRVLRRFQLLLRFLVPLRSLCALR